MSTQTTILDTEKAYEVHLPTHTTFHKFNATPQNRERKHRIITHISLD